MLPPDRKKIAAFNLIAANDFLPFIWRYQNYNYISKGLENDLPAFGIGSVLYSILYECNLNPDFPQNKDLQIANKSFIGEETHSLVCGLVLGSKGLKRRQEERTDAAWRLTARCSSVPLLFQSPLQQIHSLIEIQQKERRRVSAQPLGLMANTRLLLSFMTGILLKESTKEKSI